MRKAKRVERNLDDVPKIAGIITYQSAGLVLMIWCAAQGLELLGLWRLLLGTFSTAAPILVAGGSAIVLTAIERRHDRYYAINWIRYHVRREHAFRYSPHVAPRLQQNPYTRT